MGRFSSAVMRLPHLLLRIDSSVLSAADGRHRERRRASVGVVAGSLDRRVRTLFSRARRRDVGRGECPAAAERFFSPGVWFVDAGPSGSDLGHAVTIRNALVRRRPHRDGRQRNDSIESASSPSGLACRARESGPSSSSF